MEKKIFYISIAWHIFFFLFIPKLIELPGLLESWWTYKGLVYYKDFATFHFPLGRWVLLPFYILTDWNLLTGPVFGLLINIATVVIIYKFGQKHFTKAGTTIAVIFFTLFSWYLGTGIMFYHEMLVGLMLLTTYYYFTEPHAGFKLGIIAGLTELVGQIISPTLIIFSALYIFKHPKKIFIFLLGALVPLSLLSLYFLSNNAFGDFFKQNFLYYTTYANTYEKVPLLSLPLAELGLFYLPLALSLYYFLCLRLKHKKIEFFHLSATFLLFSTIPFVIFSVFHFHHVSFALPIATIVIGFLYSKKFYSKLVILLIILLSIKLLPWYINSSSTKNFGRIANNLTVGDTMHQTSQWVRNNTPKNATILVAGDALFYFTSNRNPSDKNAYVSPFNWEPLGQTIMEVNLNLPDYWIINRTYFTRLVKEYKKQNMVSYIEDTINYKYTKEAIFDDWEIWKRIN